MCRFFVLWAVLSIVPVARAQEFVAFPLQVIEQDQDAGQVVLRPSREGIALLCGLQETTLGGLALPDGSVRDLSVQRIDLAARRMGIQVDGVEAPGLLDELELSLWTGAVVGADESEVMLSFSRAGCMGWVTLAGSTYHLLPRRAPDGGWMGGDALLVDETWLEQRGIRSELSCSAQSLAGAPGGPPRQALAPPPPAASGGLDVRECSVAIETDFQLFEVFGELEGMVVYITTLLGFSSNRYEHQAETVLTFPYMQFYTTSDDPWHQQDQGGNCIDVLYEFRDAWGKNKPGGARLGHLLSGANLGCGVAWVDVLCEPAYGFSVSGNLNSNVAFPVVQQPNNWDFMVVTHEMGHNFGTWHTHDYCPPLDECAPDGYFGSCQNQQVCSTSGTVMSYCHLCPGGTGNITTWFHPEVSTVITAKSKVCLPPFEMVEAAFPDVLIPELSPRVVANLSRVPDGPVVAYYRYGAGSFFPEVMQPEGAGRYAVSLPAPTCAGEPDMFVAFDDAVFGQVTEPVGAPFTYHRAAVGIPLIEILEDFEQDSGWVPSNQGASSGDWQRGVPVADRGWPYAPEADYDGGGNCWLTDNSSGESDVDGGAVQLDSPVYDMSGGKTVLTYAYFLGLSEPGTDSLKVEVNNKGGNGAWTEVHRHDQDSGGVWQHVAVHRLDFLELGVQVTDQMQFRFTAEDAGGDSVVEAALDTFTVSYLVCNSIGSSYCTPANLNSTGSSAVIRAVGSDVAEHNAVVLNASQLPPNKQAFFLNSKLRDFKPFPPGSQGNLCLGSDIGRYDHALLNSLGGGWVSLILDLENTPRPVGSTSILSSQVWYFQCWFRDENPHHTSNFTDGLRIYFR